MNDTGMDGKLHEILLHADCPRNFSGNGVYTGDDADILDAIERAARVRKDLARTFKRYFTLEDDQQDAFFWGALHDPRTDVAGATQPVSMRFSFCGNLAATWTLDNHEPLLDDEKRVIESILRRHGFTWVDGDILRASRYDGKYEYFKSWHYNAPASWWDRFFEYE